MPLQKSYSDSRGIAKPHNRSTWQRSHSHPNGYHTPKPRPPIPASDATKTKLNKFRFEALVDDESPQACQSAEQAQSRPGHADQSTPVTRLNWRDLEPLANAEDTDKDASPNDRILWDNKPRGSYASGLSPMLGRRGKKRARSSSPTSSPAADKPSVPVVNIKRLTKALRSPHPDPTFELWDRFSLASPASRKTPVANPALAQLMVSSSPQPNKQPEPQPGSVNLRRAASCGLNWPKRRKLEKSKSGSQLGKGQRDLEAASKSSLVSALLNTVTSSMQEDSSGDARRAIESPSPKEKKHVAVEALPVYVPCKANGKESSGGSSDYGDDEFDDDALIELELTTTTPATQETPIKPRVSKPAAMIPPKPKSDDFDDLDDELFDNEELVRLSQKLVLQQPKREAIQKKPAVPAEDLDDEFEDDFADDIDFEAVELAATQSFQQAKANAGRINKDKTIQRYLITNVLESEYIDQYNVARPEKILLIMPDNSKLTRQVHLRGAWYDTPAHAKSYVHVIGKFSINGQCVVDDAQNLLILHPDQLVSATVVADSFGCMRRAVLQDRVKATSEASAPLVYGTMLHEIFQDALLANRWDLPFLARLIEKITEKHVEELYTIKVGLPSAREHLQSKMMELSYWAKSFVSPQPNNDAVVEDRNGKKATMAVTKLLDVEEHVWSPMYGLKGNIDATVEVNMMDGEQSRLLTVPFEVKTGRNASSSHMAQTALYTLLLSDRYDIEIAYGVLYYMETSKTMRIPAVRHELRHMIMQRNQLACYIRERSVQLPPMLKSKNMCGRCYAKPSCFIYHRLADDGDGESSGMDEQFDELVKHLTPRHQEFFIKWENLLTIEEKESQKTKRELWTMTSNEREKKSRCFADVIIEEGSASVDSDTPRINRFHYTFVKRKPGPGFSFLESEISVGEPIVVSDEEGHFALAIGYVTAQRKQRISVAVDRRLHNSRIRHPGFDEVDNQVFASIMEVAPEGASVEQSQGRIKAAPIRYRLDKDEFSNGMATVRNNIVQIMNNQFAEPRRIRELIVDLEAPRFKHIPTQYTVSEQETLNVDQKKAIEKVMSAQDYALVLGMPGTGKTTTIAHIIRALTSQGKSVLLTSHTHTAVDNILLKLKSDKMKVLRLGAPAKVHPDVQEFAILAGQPKTTFEEIKEAWHDTPVVATTCLGINHPVFQERAFDYCIVDEASQITLPICAGPIRMARTFVLVGDHNQLPPVVKNETARQGGLDVSLFKLLSDSHPDSVVNLAHQYRMCEDIMTLSNTLIYDGKLVCGTEELRKKKLHIPNMKALSQRHHNASTVLLPGTPRSFCKGPAPSQCWLYDLLESEARVRFVNTDTIRPAAREEAHGKRIVNSAEVRIVSQLVESFLTVGIPASEVGVMTHYRSQLSLLKDKLKGYPGVEMHTTDRFQGRDKEVIVLSLVRSNDACHIGELLRDWRRINVAFTRAKTKLLVIGSKSTLSGSNVNNKENMLSRFVALMEQRDWIYNLPPDALDNHYFEELGTQATSMGGTQVSSPQSHKKKSLGAKKALSAAPGKENRRPSPRKARIGERALLKDKLITRDILNEMTNGAY
ncbi:DNA replication helicase Dna2, putative [Cordyceps militaris CM01]|uniref:DNA replication ATP-dependent helicase/nuclease n=1 Tax=Cordyceps militaris (strain CM01) TaxID=983644 RepID=G3JGP4_CORMM|nr:DNA replication helicase Dna2, putative [Cordyceps militaris CM01]EGX93313.1 DNA replication helicase Dna2, putative [Cordyceps militaris CM01]